MWCEKILEHIIMMCLPYPNAPSEPKVIKYYYSIPKTQEN